MAFVTAATSFCARASISASARVLSLGCMRTAMAMDFITIYRSAAHPMVQISILSEDPSGLRPAYSVGVDDVDAVHARAVEAGHEIVYALRDEPWGVRRFFVRDPLGDIANIVQNKD